VPIIERWNQALVMLPKRSLGLLPYQLIKIHLDCVMDQGEESFKTTTLCGCPQNGSDMRQYQRLLEMPRFGTNG
jgi:hypothetical protein